MSLSSEFSPPSSASTSSGFCIPHKFCLESLDLSKIMDVLHVRNVPAKYNKTGSSGPLPSARQNLSSVKQCQTDVVWARFHRRHPPCLACSR